MQTYTEYQENEPEIIEVTPKYSENQKETELVVPKEEIVEVKEEAVATKEPKLEEKQEDKQAEEIKEEVVVEAKTEPPKETEKPTKEVIKETKPTPQAKDNNKIAIFPNDPINIRVGIEGWNARVKLMLILLLRHGSLIELRLKKLFIKP